MDRHRIALATAAALAALTLTGCGGDDDAAAQAGSEHGGDHGGGHSAGGAGGHQAAAAEDDGLSAASEGYQLAAVDAPAKPGQADELSFRIEGPDGKPHAEFVRELGKLMHVYVVREDLTQYQHLHPELDAATGTWAVQATMAEPGPYRLVTEFEALTPDGNSSSRRLGTDFRVAGDYEPVAFAPSFAENSVDDYALTITGEPKVHGESMQLTITQDGEGVEALEPYLESFAHITGFRKGDLKAVHVHPEEEPAGADATGGPELTLASHFQEPGEYRMFVQFQTDGKVRLVPIDLRVA